MLTCCATLARDAMAFARFGLVLAKCTAHAVRRTASGELAGKARCACFVPCNTSRPCNCLEATAGALRATTQGAAAAACAVLAHTAAPARLAVCLAPCILIAPRVAGKAFTLRARWLVLANVAVGAFPGLVA